MCLRAWLVKFKCLSLHVHLWVLMKLAQFLFQMVQDLTCQQQEVKPPIKSSSPLYSSSSFRCSFLLFQECFCDFMTSRLRVWKLCRIPFNLVKANQIASGWQIIHIKRVSNLSQSVWQEAVTRLTKFGISDAQMKRDPTHMLISWCLKQ